MTQRSQPVADRPEGVLDTSPEGHGPERAAAGLLAAPSRVERGAERAARATLRAQIAKLENELSALLAERFPFVTAPVAVPSAAPSVGGAAPCLQGLGELERTRDGLAGRLGELRARAARRTHHERRARELLERMRLEPGRYKYYRVPVRDLGQTGCGVYEVRPRLGLIGMLAGWWELTLSSGCPLCREARRACSTTAPGLAR
ncbi:MAG TPA: hypothetical protein VNV44_01165 [Solirubrobacteraceae bacterium]|nr:hypothetical protein [Solirubrobacteraceae bacterium]